MPLSILTIGHSTHPLDRFLELLARHGIETLVDVRRFPGSRKHPQFSRDSLAVALAMAGIDYCWLESLGGRRGKQVGETSMANLGLENESFRNYADYMLTGEFQEGLSALMAVARVRRTAIMCAEGLFWRCHRRLISDFLTARGISVKHVMPDGELRPHALTRGAVIANGRVTYPGEKSLFS